MLSIGTAGHYVLADLCAIYSMNIEYISLGVCVCKNYITHKTNARGVTAKFSIQKNFIGWDMLHTGMVWFRSGIETSDFCDVSNVAVKLSRVCSG